MALDDIKELYTTVSQDIANDYLKKKNWRLLEVKVTEITRLLQRDSKDIPMQESEIVYVLGRYK